MTERAFRFVQGGSIYVALIFEYDILLYVLVAILAFEGITNLRIPKLVSMARYGSNWQQETGQNTTCRYNVEAERILRVAIASMLVLSYVAFPNEIWFFPWFIGAMLLVAGITNICPSVVFLRYIGFR